MKKLRVQSQGRADDFQTPKYAADYLIPFLNKEWIIWECACGKGNLQRALEEKGFKVWGTDITGGMDFLKDPIPSIEFDCIITNPPYSLKEQFLSRCFELKKPFALLMTLTALEGKKRGRILRENHIQLIIPDRRINFETPDNKNSGAWFSSAWFCSGLNLPKDLIFCESRGLKND